MTYGASITSVSWKKGTQMQSIRLRRKPVCVCGSYAFYTDRRGSRMFPVIHGPRRGSARCQCCGALRPKWVDGQWVQERDTDTPVVRSEE